MVASGSLANNTGSCALALSQRMQGRWALANEGKMGSVCLATNAESWALGFWLSTQQGGLWLIEQEELWLSG